MNKNTELPKLTKKRKINHKRFMALAKTVRQSLIEEAKYLEEKISKDENSFTGRILFNS